VLLLFLCGWYWPRSLIVAALRGTGGMVAEYGTGIERVARWCEDA